MLSGQRFLITGLTRLTVRVAESLMERGADVVVIADSISATGEAADLIDMLPDAVTVVGAGRDRDQSLRDAGLVGAAGMLALSENDLDNLRDAADAHELAPAVPIVLRTFQPELADHLSSALNIRRAYSVAGLSAPAFVAASFSEHVIETLRLADEEIPLCVLDVHPSTPLVGHDVERIKQDTDCAIVAVSRDQDTWLPASAFADALQAGDRVLAGGRHADVLRLAARNAPAAPDVPRRRRPRRYRSHHVTSTLLPISAGIFAIVFVATLVVNAVTFELDATDAVRVALLTALGSAPTDPGDEWVQVFNIASIIAGTILVWILLSHLTAIVLAERLEAQMTKRAGRMKDHVVVVGLGKVGYRVVQLLGEMGVPTVAIEKEPDSRFVEVVGLHAPVLTGDGQLGENLVRCGIERARCVIACSNDDLANLASCLEARALQPGIRTVARVFDESLARRLGRAFQIDVALSSTTIAATAFVGAATDAFAMRPIDLDGLDLLAFRFTARATISASEMEPWRVDGLRVLAVQAGDGEVEPPSAAVDRGLNVDDRAVVVGPADVVRRFVDAHAPSP